MKHLLPTYSSPLDEFYAYTNELEPLWRESLPQLTERQWLEVFPEAKAVIPIKIQEWREERHVIAKRIKDSLSFIKEQTSDPLTLEFWREWLKWSDGTTLAAIDRHLRRLKSLLSTKQQSPQNKLIEELLITARERDLIELIDFPVRKGGRTYFGRCPFHQDRTPSFHIYPVTNTFYCFGCNKSGDVITYVMLTCHLSFKDALHYLVSEEQL